MSEHDAAIPELESLYERAVDAALKSNEFSRVVSETSNLDPKRLGEDALRLQEQAFIAVRDESARVERADARLAAIKGLIAQGGGSVSRTLATFGARLAVLLAIALLAQTIYAVLTGAQMVLAKWSDSIGVAPTVAAVTVALLAPFLPLVIRVRLQRRIAEELGLEVASMDAQTARERLEQALLERAAKPALRELVNSAIAESWSFEFGIRDAPGLRELSDPSFEVSTHAKTSLVTLLSQRGSGSIGVAGPRGAGKTTLINAMAKPVSKRGEKSIGVVLSAPVRYEPRDFLLHLFATVAEQVVSKDKAARAQIDASADLHHQSRRQLSDATLLTSLLFFTLAGTTWLGGSLAITATASERVAITFAGLGAVAAAFYSLLITSADGRSTDIAPLILVRDHHPSWAQQLIRTMPLGEPLMAVLQYFSKRDRRARGSEAEAIVPESVEEIDIEDAALRELENIRFQQTFSSGWSGSLKLPGGLGLGTDAKLSLAQSQRTLPEIADRFVAFTGQVAKKRTVVIGLDELDKMESEESARQFLNDVKGVFGITGCHFLISVSEDAMSDFDRRGLPFRDVFDSSLDEVFHVPYLTLEEGQRLLNSRVIGLSQPFQCLCFALSGGLARDLIRITRSMVAHNKDTGTTALATMTYEILEADVATKNRASVVAARRTGSHLCVGLFTDWIRKGDAAAFTPALLEERIETFGDTVANRLPDSPRGTSGDDDRDDPASAICRIGSELIAYYYLAMTAMSLFNSLGERSDVQAAIRDGRIAQLARARQDLAISPLVAWTTLSGLREATYGMKSLSPPPVLTGDDERNGRLGRFTDRLRG